VTEPGHSPHSPLDTFLGASPRRRRRHWFSILVLAAAAAAAVMLFQRFLVGSDLPWYTAPVEQGDIAPLLTLRGTLHGEGEVTVAAAQDGVIVAVPGPADGHVAAGQDLAAMDTAAFARTLTADVAQQKMAADAQARAQITARELRERLERYESVWRRSAGRVPSLNEMENARAAAARADLDVASAAARVDQAGAQVEADRAALAGAVARAPFAGYVVARHVSPGMAVRAGQPLFTLAAHAEKLSIAVPVSAAQADSLKPGIEVRVLVDGLPDAVYPARLLRMDAAGPGGDGRVAIFALQPPEDEDAGQPGPEDARSAPHPGMAATAQISLPVRSGVLLVPNAALAFSPSGSGASAQLRVFVVGEDGAPRRVAVSVGGTDGKHSQVLPADQAGALHPGVQVITGWRQAQHGPASGASARPAGQR